MNKATKIMLIVTIIVVTITLGRISWLIGYVRGFNDGAQEQHQMDNIAKPDRLPQKIIPVPRTCPQEFSHPDSIREI